MRNARFFLLSCIYLFFAAQLIAQPISYGFYTVQKGDYLSKIAREFNVSVSQLRIWNGLDGDMLKEGQSLRVLPPSSFVSATATPSSNSFERANYYSTRGINTGNYNSAAYSTPLPTYQSPAGYTNVATVQNPVIQNNPTYTTRGMNYFNTFQGWVVHLAKRGESIQAIADLYGATAAEIREYNNLTTSIVPADGMLFIKYIDPAYPNPTYSSRSAVNTPIVQSRGLNMYERTVQPGETLFRIAQEAGTNMQVIIEMNQLTSNQLRAGQKLIVPAR